MNKTYESLPKYLQVYCAEQHYDRYTPRDHEAWRYIMRQSRAYFREHALPIYLDGLRKTGITVERIPRISEMDEALREFGWGAVPVCGFIPPAAFLEFQARGILAIATDMRSIDHIAYTPAPDIVHEAAGHAPIVADPRYREYLQRYGKMAQKAIMSKEDLAVYEAIRYLSDIKENPDTNPEQIFAAQQRLDKAVLGITHATEAAKLGRMGWWTIEYGLMGSLASPKIYGAGLLSSVGESQNCLSPKVRKVPLTADCVETSYDITEPQPQLFVAQDMDHLFAVLDTFEETLAFRTGGIGGLAKAKQGAAMTTVQLDSGIEVSGVLSDYFDSGNDVSFVKFSGPCQLAVAETELTGQGRSRHGEGFSSPLGRWTCFADRDPQHVTTSQLQQAGLVVGKQARLEFMNGFVVEGVPSRFYFQTIQGQARLLYITWQNCTVKRGETRYFEPAWGEFDMLVGTKVSSVYGGPADRNAYGEYDMGQASSQPGRQSPFTAQEKRVFGIYSEIRTLRGKQDSQKVGQLESQVLGDHPQEWLLALDLLEMKSQSGCAPEELRALRAHLDAAVLRSDLVTAGLIAKGLALSSQVI